MSGEGLIILLVGIVCSVTRYRCVVIICRHQAAVYTMFLVLELISLTEISLKYLDWVSSSLISSSFEL